MNRRKIILLTAFLVTHSALFKAKSQVSGTWSGTITEHSWFGGHPGVVAETIGNIRYSRNVGTATYSETGTITVDGKVISRTNCSGSGTVGFAELSIEAANNIYTIQSSALVYYCSYLNATPDSGELYITIGNEPWDGSPRVLKGSKTLVTENGGGGKLTTITTWHLVKDSETELIVTPQKYDTWLPIPGRDEQTPGPDMMTVKLELKDRNGRPASEKAKSFELTLSNTSKEKGITINMPLVPAAQQLPDLQFQPQQGAVITQEGQSMTIFCPTGCLTTSFKIACFDGGAWTTLTAKAVLEADSIKGNLLQSGGDEEILIPKRAPGSVIAKVWADANGNPADMDDKEEKDPHASEGDGLTAYEEYRGFFSEGIYKRLDPAKKELAVRVKIAELGLFSEGLNWFEQGSKLKVVRFYIHEVANDRRINFNSGHAHGYDQYALKLDNGNLPSDKAGKAFTTSSLPDIPKNTTQVVIAVRNISVNYQNWLNYARGSNQRLPWTEREYIAQTVAHEIGHGVKVWHHGEDSGTPQAETAVQGSPPVFHIFNRSAIEITTRPFTIPDRVCSQGTQASGDLSCVMAYIDVCDWVRIPYADGSVGYFESPLLSIGRGFCKKKDGTGENAGFHSVSGVSYANLFGKAGKGECLGQITLR